MRVVDKSNVYIREAAGSVYRTSETFFFFFVEHFRGFGEQHCMASLGSIF